MKSNLLLDRLPQYTPSGLKIRTDFRESIKFELLMQDRNINEENKVKLALNLYYDKTTSEYIIERDNNEDTLNSSLTGIDFIININVNKVVNYKKFSGYRIVEVSPDLSPNTLKQGFVKFVFVDKDENVVKFQNDDGRIAITVTKIY